MIVTFEYPKTSILYGDLNNPYNVSYRNGYCCMVSSMTCTGYEKIKRCNLLIYYSKRANKNPGIRKRYYFNHEELKQICIKLFSKYYLQNTKIVDWEFIELAPSFVPQVIVKVIKL